MYNKTMILIIWDNIWQMNWQKKDKQIASYNLMCFFIKIFFFIVFLSPCYRYWHIIATIIGHITGQVYSVFITIFREAYVVNCVLDLCTCMHTYNKEDKAVSSSNVTWGSTVPKVSLNSSSTSWLTQDFELFQETWIGPQSA